jgi:predicted secreted protein
VDRKVVEAQQKLVELKRAHQPECAIRLQVISRFGFSFYAFGSKLTRCTWLRCRP